MKPKPTQRPQAGLFLIISYLLWGSVALRWITELAEAHHPQIVLVGSMLLLYGLFLGLEPWITGNIPWRGHLYLAAQTLLAFGAIFFFYQLDFFAILLLPVGGQAVFLFPGSSGSSENSVRSVGAPLQGFPKTFFRRRTAAIWVSILMLLNVIGQINQFGWPAALTFILLYSAALVFVAAFSARTVQAEAARAQAETLLAELQQANHQLQELAGQAEELATAKERNRLARDLHNSVAQTLYGLTLQSEAASRQLAIGQTGRAAQYLQEIRQSTLQTLGEICLLIFELRPPILAEIGLSAALRARLEAVEARSGLQVETALEDVGRLPSAMEVGLYRIAQEALNNILKHAHAKCVHVTLHRRDNSLTLEVHDDGVGMPAELTDLPGRGGHGSHSGLGLQSMAERAELIGARLAISGQPGQGMSIKVEVPL